MFCPKCGCALPDDANVCSSCGNPLNDQGSINLAAAAAAGLATGEKKKSKAPLFIGLAAAVLVVAALLFVGCNLLSESSVEPIVGNWTSSVYYDQEAAELQPLGKDGCILNVEKDGDFVLRIGSDDPSTGTWRVFVTDDGDTTYPLQTDDGALLMAGMVDDPDLDCELTLLVGDYLVLFNRK